MRFTALLFIFLPFLASLYCAGKAPYSSGEPETAWSSTDEASLSVYDRLEGRFQNLCTHHQERHGEAPLLIEAREVAAVAEDLYLLAEYRQALEILQQAVDLLEDRQGIEQTHR